MDFTPRLSDHFTLEELTASRYAKEHGIDNSAPAHLMDNAKRLAITLEHVRQLLGVPLVVSSGYRCPELNSAIGGVATSAHLQFLAADFRPQGLDLQTAFVAIGKTTRVPFDQLILEHNGAGASWIHLGLESPGKIRRGQILAGEKGARLQRVALG